MQSEQSEAEKKAPITKTSNRLYQAGIFLICVAVLLLLWSFYPVLYQEIRYQFSPKNNNSPVISKEEAGKDAQPPKNALEPADENFGIVIPKILANAKVIADVNSQNSAEYQRALIKGVAHAKGTAKPGELGNVFIFSHSGLDFYEANRYNAVFYLINKLEKGDDIYVFYNKNKVVYRVTDKKIVAEDQIQYMEGDPQKKTLTLMTCWPAGTTFKRLIVVANQAENN